MISQNIGYSTKEVQRLLIMFTAKKKDFRDYHIVS